MALAALVMAACLLLVLVLIGADTGLTGFVAGFVFALVPVCIVLPALLWLDRLEAEPVGQLLFAFGWGAVVATFIALIVNSYSLAALTEYGGDISTAAVFVAPWVEEVSKGLAVLVVLLVSCAVRYADRHDLDATGIAVLAGALVLGLAYIVVFYLSQSQYPVEALGPWNVVIGFGIIMAGFMMATRWR